MNVSSQIAKHLRDVHFGGNWTWSNLKDQLKDITWQQALVKIDSLNTIAMLVYHMNYYVAAQIKVLEGGPLDAKDELSYNHDLITSQSDWEELREKALTDAEKLATLIEKLPESKLSESFTDEKYGSYYRNLQGMIEHTHYHLGQIAVIKKMIIAATTR